MKISYNWLKDCVDCNIDENEASKILTGTGLEVEGTETVETVKGGLKGLVVGHVLTCKPHPDSDHMHVTTVDTGSGEPVQIVCGAPNVAAGQKVIVATIGAVLYDGDKSFTIKKSKLRGEVSMGMLCAEDEIGVGNSHDGIIVLPQDAIPGTPAAEIFKVDSDTVFEVAITPNRIDGASHIGCARDIYAYLMTNPGSGRVHLKMPDVSAFKIDDNSKNIPVEIVNPEACKRYSAITVSGIKVKESPEWLKKRLSAVGVRPINNVVDATNFILFELGQPLHAFDADKIKCGKVFVKTLAQDTPFVTLDGTERKLDAKDLMICDAEGPMCMAGVFGGLNSGISEQTTDVFIESACFDPVYVRKTAKRHNLHTDAAFHFERGCDANQTVYVLKRAAMLIKEVAGGKISSEIIDVYPQEVKPVTVELSFDYVDSIIGKKIEADTIEIILKALDFEIIERNSKTMIVKVPTYRVDVTRACDVVEEILRIYGYDNVEMPEQVKSVLQYAEKPNKTRITIKTSDYLSSCGFCEAMSNSLVKGSYYENLESYKAENAVKLLNPLSADLNVMRMSLVFGALEATSYNLNRQNDDIRLYEFGNCWTKGLKKSDNKANLAEYDFENHLMLTVCGNVNRHNWTTPVRSGDFYYIKTFVFNILERLGYNIDSLIVDETQKKDIFAYGLEIKSGRETLAETGCISRKLSKIFDIEKEVFYAEINWSKVFALMPKEIKFKPVSKFPEVKRDFALLLDENIKFSDIKRLAMKAEKQYLKEVTIFDVYKDAKLGKGKKSYAVTFVFQNNEATFTDAQINDAMDRIRSAFENEAGAQIR